MTASEVSERRRHRRFQLRVPVTVLGASDQPASRDLSEGGMFIETSVPRAIGVVMPLRLVHPETGEIIPAVCQVVRQVHDEDGQLLGLGLRFANTDESLGSRIRNLINDLVDEADRDGEQHDGHDAPEESSDDPDELDDDDEADSALAVVEFDEPEVTWESGDDGDAVDVLVVEADVANGAEHHPASVPIIWPDTAPEKIPGALRHGLTPMQLRLLPFIDGNNTVEEVAHGAGLDVEPALGELSDMARRGVVRIPMQGATDEDLAAWEESTEASPEPKHAQPLFPGRRETVAEQERWREARSLVTQGLAAERNDDFEDAVALLESALELTPPNAANIHARLAIIGMEHLGDLDLAETHARAAEEADPHRPHGRRLLRRIKRLRARGVRIKPRATKRKPKPRRRPTQQKKKPTATAGSSRRTVMILVMVLTTVGLLAWNAHKYLLPILNAPPHLDVTQLATLIPAESARIRDGKLVITTSEAWDTLTTMEKTDRLERLAAWARAKHDVSEIVVADNTPVMRARVSGTKIKIFLGR